MLISYDTVYFDLGLGGFTFAYNDGFRLLLFVATDVVVHLW
jgi:hypothetical protein